ncbi:MAG: ribonuclease HII [Candidatus Woesearchaeota archaeon]
MGILGIDEAGRGPVIGPMVIAAVYLADEKKGTALLNTLQVKDSKMLSDEQRRNVFAMIKKYAASNELQYQALIITPKEIDNAVESKTTNLNWLEADHAKMLIETFKPGTVYVDCPSTNPKKFTSYLKQHLSYHPKLIVEHKADAKYPIVSAASIVAKVIRDNEIESLKKKYKVDFGSGYPSDPRTQEFLDKHALHYPFFRTSWASYKARIKPKEKRESKQETLQEFFKK